MEGTLPIAVTIILSIFGGGALTSLLQYLITRHDEKNGKYKEVIDDLKETRKDIEGLRAELAEDRATNARIRILQFSDDLHHGLNKSKESFEQVHQDIDRYNKYCKAHKDYENSLAVAAISHIQHEYTERLSNDGFLD